MSELESIRQRLSELGEELADVALRHLRSAAAGGEGQQEERLVTRARRAVERAVHLLDQAGGEPEGDGPEDW